VILNLKQLTGFGRTKYSKNISLTFATNCVFLFSGILAARYLTLEARGIAAIFVTVSGIVSYVLDFGVTNAVFIATAKERDPPRHFQSFKYYFLFTVLASGITYYVLWLYKYPDLLIVMPAVVIFALASVLFRIYGARLSGSNNLELYNKIKMMQSLIWCTLLLLVIHLGPTAMGFIWSYVISWFIGSLMMVHFGRGRFYKAMETRKFFKSGLSSFFTNQNAIDGLKLDQFVAAKNAETAALVSVFGSVVQQAKILPLSLFPIISRDIHKLASNSTLNSSRLMIVTPLSILALSPAVIFGFPFLVGEKYQDQEFSILLYLCAAVFSVTRNLYEEKLRSEDKAIGIVLSETLGGVVFCTFFLMGFAADIQGIAVGVFLSQLVVLLAVFGSWKLRKSNA
jgi:O-antigen/teichoic acid export membrane protein